MTETLRMYLKEALEVMSQGSVEDRALRTPWAIDLSTRCGSGRLHSEE
ncbi:MAG: hypothetical protein GY769_15805 [bacterium]|nr:hypothetical protein [bacterium]